MFSNFFFEFTFLGVVISPLLISLYIYTYLCIYRKGKKKINKTGFPSVKKKATVKRDGLKKAKVEEAEKPRPVEKKKLGKKLGPKTSPSRQAKTVTASKKTKKTISPRPSGSRSISSNLGRRSTTMSKNYRFL